MNNIEKFEQLPTSAKQEIKALTDAMHKAEQDVNIANHQYFYANSVMRRTRMCLFKETEKVLDNGISKLEEAIHRHGLTGIYATEAWTI
jgi:hypothetical protein